MDVYRRKYGKTNIGLDRETRESLTSYPWPGNIRELQHAVERAVILSDGNSISPGDLFPDKRTSSGTRMNSRTLEENEKEYIREVLENNEGNVTQTAKVLGLTRTALYRRLNKYGLA